MDTVVFEMDETMDFDMQRHRQSQPPQKPQAQVDTHGSHQGIDTHDIMAMHDYLQGVRQKQQDETPYTQKLDQVMQRTNDVERLARTAALQVVGLKRDLERGFEQIHKSLERLASGQSPYEEHPPGSSIFDT